MSLLAPTNTITTHFTAIDKKSFQATVDSPRLCTVVYGLTLNNKLRSISLLVNKVKV